ncbi:phosphoenolpyruvate--protein phosphotransferase [Agaribacter marinus]|uniref:phosphoenolpyruvate--protein phosphotransferase n=1 Tax=Agaribacter marinus TaxID=1431249 RepID=A0AA37T6I8_9ALTE|nr:phosphoenolpyruvate--protein phosphotransferase [Agaribacter marinus]GLR72385.1 phosphoenolpyruvate--protein phosphotransferase [Agaribacter marinus]
MLTILKQIIQEVGQLPNLHESLDRLATLVKQNMGVDSCAVYLADWNTRRYVLTATDGLDKSAIGQVKLSFDEGLIGLVGDREEPLNIENAPQHPSYKHFPEVNEEQYNAFIGTPIIHQRKVLGVISLQQESSRKFSEDDEAFLVTLAAQVALYIANAEMQGQVSFNEDRVLDGRDQRILNGIPGSPGLAIGIGYAADFKHELKNLVTRRAPDTETQINRYRQAVDITRKHVAELSTGLSNALPDDVKAIFQLYNQLLDANSLGREVENKIKEGWNASSSLKFVVEAYAQRFENMDDPYMRERAVDIIDLSNRILANIIGDVEKPQTLEPNIRYILVANEVSAPMLAEFPPDQLAGIVSIKGSNNSHAAIMARAMGVPAVMGLPSVSVNLLKSQELFIDGYSGRLALNIDVGAKQGYQHLINQELALFEKIDSEADAPPITQDGTKISLLVNAGLSADLELEQYRQGDGVGLYRTEIPFMMRDRFPSEREQCEIYKDVLVTHPNKEITMRTLDVGGDKPLAYFPISEENPFLGWRGIRLTLDHPDIFLVQVRAMLRASLGLSNLHILLPMISSVSEVDEAKRLIKQAFLEVKSEAMEHQQMLSKPAVGVMLEVPAVLFQLPQLAQRVDFFSVGTNDMTQYLLAVDRNNPRVSSLYSSYHPSVVNALQLIREVSTQYKVPVTVCGELAGEPMGALLLIAMGYRKLSMNAHSLRKISWVIRNISVDDTREILDDILRYESPQDVQSKLSEYLENQKLGGLVRAGK